MGMEKKFHAFFFFSYGLMEITCRICGAALNRCFRFQCFQFDLLHACIMLVRMNIAIINHLKNIQMHLL